MGMRTRFSLPAVLLMAVLAGGVLAGCGGAGPGEPDGYAQTGETVTEPPSPGALPPSIRVSPTPRDLDKSAVELTITGVAEEGVESGCIVMRSGDTMYNLLGGDRSTLMSGRTVIVRGKAVPGLMTTCQQGTPFQVSEVRLA